MYLTPEQKIAGRRALWRAAAQDLDRDRLRLETSVPGSIGGGPVRGGVVGIGRHGKVMLSHCRKEFIDIQAVCDVNPAHLSQARDALMTATGRRPREYADWQEMAEKEDLEVVIVATPLWTHADITVAFLDAGVHVLCEKMMAYDAGSGLRMLEAARRNRRLLEVAYPRFYEPMYQAAYSNVIETRLLGDIHFVRLVTHRDSNWRSDEKPPSAGFDPRPWGYPTWDHLVNWRMYKRYSRGLFAELGSHQTSLAEWYLGSRARSVYGAGGIFCYKDGREVDDHIHATFEFPKGCTVELSVILSNRYGGLYEEFLGTKGSLVLSDQDGAMLFTNEPARAKGEIPEGRDETLPWSPDWSIAYRTEIWAFCSAVRRGTPLLCGAERGLASAVATLAGHEAIATRARVAIAESPDHAAS